MWGVVPTPAGCRAEHSYDPPVTSSGSAYITSSSSNRGSSRRGNEARNAHVVSGFPVLLYRAHVRRAVRYKWPSPSGHPVAHRWCGLRERIRFDHAELVWSTLLEGRTQDTGMSSCRGYRGILKDVSMKVTKAKPEQDRDGSGTRYR